MNKWDLIKRYVENKTVLDIGAVGNQLTKNKIGFKIMARAKKYTGIDTQKSENKNIVQMNAEKLNLRKKYDVILALDIIEHLSNPGEFLKRCKTHLRKKGVLLITTPNSLALTYQIEGRFYLNKEHVNIYQEKTIKELLRRAGFTSKVVHYHDTNNLLGKIVSLFLIKDMKRSLFVEAKSSL